MIFYSLILYIHSLDDCCASVEPYQNSCPITNPSVGRMLFVFTTLGESGGSSEQVNLTIISGSIFCPNYNNKYINMMYLYFS